MSFLNRLTSVCFVLLLVFCVGNLRAEELILGEKDFTLVDGIQQAAKTRVTHTDGIFKIEIQPTRKIVNGTRGAVLNVPLEKLCGKTVRFSLQARCSGITSDTVGSHVGGKLLIEVRSPQGTRYYGSFTLTGSVREWEDLSILCSIPQNAERVIMVAGIQQGWGVMEFRNPVLEIDEPEGVTLKPRTLPPLKNAPGTGSSYNFILLGDTHFERDVEVYHSKFRYSPDAAFAKVQHQEFLHYAAMWKTRSPELLKAAQATGEQYKAPFVIQLGDLVQGDCSSFEGHARMLYEALDVFKNNFTGRKFLSVCGNHDVRSVCGPEAYHEVMTRYHSRELGKDIRKTTFAFRHENDLYVFVDFNRIDPGEVKRIFEENKDARYKFVLIHAPVLPSDGGSAHWFYLGELNQKRAEIRELFLRNDVIVLAGHTHTYELNECQTDSGRITQFILCSVWSHDSLSTPEISAKTPEAYGKNQKAGSRGAKLTGEIAPAVTRYFRGKAAGYCRVEVTPQGVNAVFYGGATQEPTEIIKLR